MKSTNTGTIAVKLTQYCSKKQEKKISKTNEFGYSVHNYPSVCYQFSCCWQMLLIVGESYKFKDCVAATDYDWYW